MISRGLAEYRATGARFLCSRAQSAKSFELQATMDLVRLLDRQGQRDRARAVLVDVYRWFSEGFETADLRDAKALIAVLG